MAVMSSIWTIRRSTSDAKFAGVCGGVARHWNVDPVLVRVGWVLLALSGGIGLVLYVAGWLLIPVEGKERPVVYDLLGEHQAAKLSREVWIAIVVLACVLSVAALGTISPFGFGPALVLAVIWYFGYYRTKVRKAPSSSPTQPDSGGSATAGNNPPAMPPAEQTQFYSYPGPPTEFTRAADAWRERIIQVQRQSSEQTAGGASAGWAQHAGGHQGQSFQGRAKLRSQPSPSGVPQSWAAESGAAQTGPAQTGATQTGAAGGRRLRLGRPPEPRIAANRSAGHSRWMRPISERSWPIRIRSGCTPPNRSPHRSWSSRPNVCRRGGSGWSDLSRWG